MNQKPPVIIAAVPKSGSSLITSIFAAHGLWVGDCEIKPGYNAFENVNINAWLRSKKERIPFEALMRRINPRGHRWVFKCKPDHALQLAAIVGEHCMVRVHRKPASIRQSRPHVSEANLAGQIAGLRAIEGPVVDADEVMAGNYASLRAALTHCGLQFSKALTQQQIDPALWHHK